MTDQDDRDERDEAEAQKQDAAGAKSDEAAPQKNANSDAAAAPTDAKSDEAAPQRDAKSDEAAPQKDAKSDEAAAKEDAKSDEAAAKEDAKSDEAAPQKDAKSDEAEAQKDAGAAPKADETDEDAEPAAAASEVGAKPADAGQRPAMPKVEVDPETSSRKPAAWGLPLVRLDAGWTKWEIFLCTVVLVLEVLVLSLWVGLKGLSTWASNMLNWFQQASTLTLFGGLRGLGTRLTLLLALLGGSLATASGKHINIDLLTRFVRPKARLYVMVVGWLSTAFICGVAGWGFFDHIAIDDFNAKAEARPAEKVSTVTKGMGEHAFMLRKQIALDLKSLPHVVAGERYAEWLGSEEWNGWIRDAGFAERYGADKAKLLEITADMKRSPIVVIPEKGEPRGDLIKSANLVFPFGLFVLVFRFVLLSLLALSGHFSVNFESAADEIKRRHDEDVDDQGDKPEEQGT
ncbi:MAG: TRAP transporter small permease subunit [Sorangiineae bacterium PRO1]|nr:TRAP transporter small permease subunit [Sorangiineae bacterium PRO1]